MSDMEKFEHLKIQLEAIKLATNNFSDEYYLGRGGFGKVYKGELLHSKGKTWVALKRLDRTFGQGDFEFWKEIKTLSLYAHENIISLLGYCDDPDEKILVYEYASNKSLDYYLASNDLTWIQRLRICIGAARGLAYLHNPTETQVKILHRDIKSSNILLDNDWNAKISDFGLSKFAPANSQPTFQISNLVGTPGYIDPMYHEKGQLTEESDVYSFGVVLFEVLCGRFCYANNCVPLSGLVQDYYEQKKISELVYSNIKGEIDESSLRKFTDIAYKCLTKKCELRPSMAQIVEALQWSLEIQDAVDAKAEAEAIQRAGILKVKVLETTVISSEHPSDGSNHYLVVHIGDGTECYTQLVKAEWNEEITLYVENLDKQHLYITVYDILSVNEYSHRGLCSISLTDLTPDIPLTCTRPLIPDIDGMVVDIKFEVLYKPLSYANFRTLMKDVSSSVPKAPVGTPKDGGQVPKAPVGTPKDGGLLVIIISSANLYGDKNQNTSVTVRFRGKLRKTPTMMNTNNPMWVQEFTFMLEQPPPKDEKLHLEAFEHYSWKGLIPRKKSLGRYDIRLADVVKNKQPSRSYMLRPGYIVEHDKYKLLHVELHWRIP